MSDKEEYVGWLSDEWNEVLDMRQPIVRCRDCKHYHEAGIASYTPFCEWMNDSDVTPDGFCAWGERKSEGE